MAVVIIDYGAGNTKSVEFAFKRIGVDTVLSNDKTIIKSAGKIIFPGVGEASSAMNKLKKTGLDLLLPELKQPVLGICLGMQLLCKSTEENNTKGLGVFDCEVKRFTNRVKVPQIGWNTIYNLNSKLFNSVDDMSYMYSVHSYYVPKNKYAIAVSNYESEYASAIQKDNFYGVQFHPEKSSELGEQVLKNFIELI